MLKCKKNLMFLTLMFVPVLGFSQDSKNKALEKKKIPSMIAIRNEGEIIMEPGMNTFGIIGSTIGDKL